jgi:crossover junction endodeoxyribonuclease RuvC
LTDVLALDIATSLGWARGRVGEQPRCGSVRFGKAGASQLAICGHALEWAIVHLRAPLPDVIAIEGLLPPGALKRRSNEDHELLGHLHGIMMGVAFMRGVYKVHKYQLNSIRAHFLYGIAYGKGEAKHAVMRKCRSLGWLEKADDDAADACALWSYQCSLLDRDEVLRISPMFGKVVSAL